MANRIEAVDAAPLLPLELEVPQGDLNGRVVVQEPADPLCTQLFKKQIAILTVLLGCGIGSFFLIGGIAGVIILAIMVLAVFLYTLKLFLKSIELNRPTNSDHLVSLPEAEMHIPPPPQVNLKDFPKFVEEHYPTAKENIEGVLATVEKREHFLATPKAGTPELTAWFEKVETLLKHIFYLLLTEDIDPGIREACLDELASVHGRCGTAYLMTVKYWYQLLAGQEVPVQNLKNTVLILLARFRAQILEEFRTRELRTANVHAENQILVLFGKGLGIPGAELADPEDPYKPYDEDELYDRGDAYFWNEYSPEKIINRILDAANRTYSSDRRHEIDRDQINEAFQSHLEELELPADFNPDEEDLETRKIQFLYDDQNIRREGIEFLLQKLDILYPKKSQPNSVIE